MKLRVVDLLNLEKEALLKCNSSSRSQIVALKIPVTCRKSCNHCCTRQIKVTIVEALLLYAYLLENKSWPPVKSRISGMPPGVSQFDEETYNRLRIMCPVNDPGSGLCTGYKMRPAICATFFSMSDPRACDPHYPGQIERTNFINIPAYLTFHKQLAARGFDIQGLVPLPQALLAAESLAEKEFEDLDAFLRHLRPR